MTEPDPYALAQQFIPAQVTAASPPTLVMLSGLPGSGKSYLACRLRARLGAEIVEADRVRKALFTEPLYTAEESKLVHRVCRIVVGNILRRGGNAIYDATNLVEFHRTFVYRLAERCQARLVIVQTIAPEEVIRERLAARLAERNPLDASDADWQIYEKLKRAISKRDRFAHRVVVVDTTQDTEESVARILQVIREAAPLAPRGPTA